jgi:hypothetical protein
MSLEDGGEVTSEDAQRVGVIKIERAGGYWKDRIRNYRILLDGSLAGKISEYGVVRLDAPPGEHVLQFKCDFVGSPELKVNVEAGCEVAVVCAAGRLKDRPRVRGYVKVWLGELTTAAPPDTQPPAL